MFKMGCVYSGPAGRNRDGIRSFRVHNVDDQGMELNRGIIEIRDNDLVLYQKGKEPIRWPLRCLRRYGFDAELFSFESGRRCVNGPGIYAFKCVHAEELFSLVQESLHRAGQEEHRGPPASYSQPGSVPAGTTHDVRPTAAAVNDHVARDHTAYGIILSDDMQQSQNSTHGNSAHLYVNGTMVAESEHDYVNSSSTQPCGQPFLIDETAALVDFLHNPPLAAVDKRQSRVQYAELCMPDCHLSEASMENLLDETGQGALHNVNRRALMSNISADLTRQSLSCELLGLPQDSDSILQAADSEVFLANVPADAGSNYVNVAFEENGISSVQEDCVVVLEDIDLPPSHDALTNYANLTLHDQPSTRPTRQVNYIVIDHASQNSDTVSSNGANNSPTSPTSFVSLPESPNRKTEGYAMIDFDRTFALSKNAIRPSEEDEGSRKTRHNSTINDMP